MPIIKCRLYYIHNTASQCMDIAHVADLAARLLQGSYAGERIKESAESLAERVRETEERARERAREAAERWKGKLRSVVRALVLSLSADGDCAQGQGNLWQHHCGYQITSVHASSGSRIAELVLHGRGDFAVQNSAAAHVVNLEH